ncbi:MAG: hypothetical protein IK100_02945 [Muribaculaceae bacterium]|nr:hypothetical protein [Muribaculaceae bacterium]
MKKTLVILLLCLTTSFFSIASDKIRISVLKEISEHVAKSYPFPWQVSTYKYSYQTHYGGKVYTSIRYFIFSSEEFNQNSSIEIIAKRDGAPWEVRINGSSHYASFSDDDEIRAGDTGVLIYEGKTLYFVKY